MGSFLEVFKKVQILFGDCVLNVEVVVLEEVEVPGVHLTVDLWDHGRGELPVSDVSPAGLREVAVMIRMISTRSR